jgi:L-lactate dehydrogenase complex protein LldG
VGSREEILEALRRNAPRQVPHPDLSGLGVRYPDKAVQFAEALKGVGGTCLRVDDLLAAHRALAEQSFYRESKRVVSLVAGVGHANLDPGALSDPRELEGLDLAILPGELAVAENGAVYLDAALLAQRALYVIAEQLVLVCAAENLVNDMHEAYALLASREVRYGLFISGPSKTADIEQALVIGAQGPRSCTVILVGAPA